VQVAPIKPTLRAPGIKLSKLKYDKPISNFAFKFNLRRCIKALHATGKVGKLSLGTESMLQVRTAHVAGVTPASVVVPALTALTPACAALVRRCRLTLSNPC
jgi:hypothetical protein